MFEIYKDKAGEFRFRLKSKNGQYILASEGYKQRASCEKGIESVRKNSQDDSLFELKEGSTKKWHFNLKATNGQIIGTSQVYETKSGATKGIKSVKINALNTDVREILD